MRERDRRIERERWIERSERIKRWEEKAPGRKNRRNQAEGNAQDAPGEGTDQEKQGDRGRVGTFHRKEDCVPSWTTSNSEKAGRGELQNGHRDSTRVHRVTSPHAAILDWDLEQRFLCLKKKGKAVGGYCSVTQESKDIPTKVQNKCKKPNLKVSWADQTGDSLTRSCPFDGDSSSATVRDSTLTTISCLLG